MFSAAPSPGFCGFVFPFVSSARFSFSFFSVSVLPSLWRFWSVAFGSVAVRLPPARAARVSVVFAASLVGVRRLSGLTAGW
mmetsp:Transcript_88317/g.201975  ORF Transcript_88317/g.201975 Transcript_88317/m.201975 type:complete len:81 (+) Transcript_88317:409-651(+)